MIMHVNIYLLHLLFRKLDELFPCLRVNLFGDSIECFIQRDLYSICVWVGGCLSVCVCKRMCVHLYVQVYVFVYVCVCVWVCACVRVYVCAYVIAHVDMDVDVDVDV